MKSIYVDDQLHSSLKVLASIENKALSAVVEECLEFSLRKKLADLPTHAIEQLAAAGGSFAFLGHKHEDVYRPEDGEPVT